MDAAPTGMAALLALVTALAGCTAEEPPAPPPAQPTPGPEAPPEQPVEPTAANASPLVQVFDGSVSGVATPDPVGVYVFGMGSEHVFEFDLPEGTTAVVIEAAWNGPDALDLLLTVPVEYCERGATPELSTCPDAPADRDGSSPAVVRIVEPEFLNLTGTWTLGLWAKQSPQPVSFRAAVSVFQAALPGDGYTALAPATP